METSAYGARAPGLALEPMAIERRQPGPRDVQIEIAYCGVCHSDLHTVRSEWGGTRYPCVPGHEIVGHVSAIGSDVDAFKLGDTVGVGCMVDSCQGCHACSDGLEQYCENGFTGTYNGRTADAPGHTLGGYSTRIVVAERFVLRISHPRGQLAAVAPLLCRDGTLCLVGLPEKAHPSPGVGPLIMGRKAIAGSLIGGIAETQEMLDFCAEHGIVAEIEVIRADQIDAAYERMLRSDVRYRFVVDNATLPAG